MQLLQLLRRQEANVADRFLQKNSKRKCRIRPIPSIMQGVSQASVAIAQKKPNPIVAFAQETVRECCRSYSADIFEVQMSHLQKNSRCRCRMAEYLCEVGESCKTDLS